MSSPTPTQRATAAHRLSFALRDLELVDQLESQEAYDAITRLKAAVDVAVEALTRA